MNFNLLKQRIVSSVLITISVTVINPGNGEGVEIGTNNLCRQFSINSLCKSIQL